LFVVGDCDCEIVAGFEILLLEALQLFELLSLGHGISSQFA